MASTSSGDQLAKLVLIFVGVAAFNAFRRGELAGWARAKFLNYGDPAPAGAPGSFAGLLAAAGATVGDTISASTQAATGTTGSEAATVAGLVQVGNTKMSARFASRWQPMAAAAARDGIILTGNAWRSNATQIRLREQHGCGGANLYNHKCKGNPPTAVPGDSRHETGDAIDVTLTGPGGRRSPEYLWLVKHAASYGIYNLPSEPWHWSIDGK